MANHVVIFPLPAQGHINCMLKLAEVLSVDGFHVTFINSHFDHHRLSHFSASYRCLSQRPGFRFCSIPDGLDENNPRSSIRFMDMLESMSGSSRGLLKEILSSTDDEFPPASCLIVDGLLNFAFDVAEELGITTVAFRTASASSLWCYFCIPQLIHHRILPFSDEVDMDELVQHVLGMESFLRRRDLPSFMRQARETTDQMLQFVSSTATNACRAKALILNTCEALEGPAVDCIRSVCPTIYTVGPLHTLLRTFSNKDNSAAAPKPNISASLWLEDETSMRWLDAQPPRSVIYVSFGSVTVIKHEELNEIWHGLANSGKRFLWVIRQDLIYGREGNEEPLQAPSPEVEKATKERGCMVSWAPQADVLEHTAVGAFLTHGGWNSTLESIMSAIPMVCWPFFADQQINSRLISEVWGVGLDMKDTCDRYVVENMVRDVMEGETAKKLNKTVRKMAKEIMSSIEQGGSSNTSIQSLIKFIRSLNPQTHERELS